MKVRVRRSDDLTAMDIAIFETEAPPRIHEQIRFNDDGEAVFRVISVIYDLERFRPGASPDVIVVVSPNFLDVQHFDFTVVWQNKTERPEWMPEDVQIFGNYVLRVGEMLTIGLIDPQTVAAIKDGNRVEPHTIDVEIVAVAHGSIIQQEQEDYDQGLGFGDLVTEIHVRKATRGLHGDIQRLIARQN